MTILVKDRVLREAFRRGERVALARVYREYARDLFALLSRGFSVQTRSGSHYFNGFKEPWTLESAVQDVFSKAFSTKARMAYDGIRPFKNYLFTIARNHIVDLFRKKQKDFLLLDNMEEFEGGDSLHEPEKQSKNPEEAAFERKMKAHVQEYLDTLPKNQMDIFDARFLSEMSIEDTARKLSVTEYSVKRDEKRIKKNFFNFMKSNGYFTGYRFSDLGVERNIVMVLAFYGAMG